MSTAKKQSMKVKLFSVEAADEDTSLGDVLAIIDATTLEQRLRRLAGGHEIRIEKVVRPGERKPYWLLDFVRLRFEHGPGRASARTPLEGFELAEGDGFGEETAMLFDPKTGSLFMQYNHFGVKESAAEAYFSMFDDQRAYGFEFLPALDSSVEAKLASASQFSKFTMKVAPAGINKDLRKSNVSLGRALDIADELRAPVVELTVGVGHARTGLPVPSVHDAVNFVKRMIRVSPDSVLRAGVVGKDMSNDDAPSEFLDLIAPKKVWDFDNLELGSDLRYTQSSRFNALERARLDWLRHR